MRNPRSLAAILLIAACNFAPLVGAAEAQPAAQDPVIEQKMMKIAEVLRCLVCQNQTIADSHAELAIDLKNQVREKLKAGMSEKEIVDFMVQRYGDFVLYNPPVKPTTWVLWVGPFALMIGGLAVLFVKLRRRASERGEASLSTADHERAAALLGTTEKREGR